MGFWKALTGKTWKETVSGGGSSTPKKDDKKKPTTLGQVSQTGQYAGDGFEWVQNDNTNALTRVYTGKGKDNNLGTDVKIAGASDKNTKNAIAAISANEGSVFATTKASGTTGIPFIDPAKSFTEEQGISYTPTITYDSTKTGAQNDAIRAQQQQASVPDIKPQPRPEPPVATPEELAVPEVTATPFTYTPIGGPGTFALGALPAAMGDDYTPTSAELAAQLEEAGLDDLRTDFSDIDYTTTATGDDFEVGAMMNADDPLSGGPSFSDTEPTGITSLEPGALYQNIIGYGEVDTPGERLGQFINDLGASAGQGFIEGPVQQGATGLGLYADEAVENVLGAFRKPGPYDPYSFYGRTVDPIRDNIGYAPGQIDSRLAQAAAKQRDVGIASQDAANQVTGVSDFMRSNVVEPLQPVADYFAGEISPEMRERVEKYATVDPNTTVKDILTGDVKSVSGETITRDLPALIVRGGEDLYDVVLDVVTGKAGAKGLATVFGLSAGEGAGSSNEEVQQRITAGIADGTVDVESLANSKYGGDKALAEQAIRDAATEVSLATAGPVAGAGDAALAFGLGYTGIPGVVGRLPGAAQVPFKLGGAGISGGLTEAGEQVGTNLAYNLATGQNLPLSMGVPAQFVQGTIGQGVSATPSGIASSLDMGRSVSPDTFVPTSKTAGQPAQSPVGVQSAYDRTTTSLDTMAAQNLVDDLVSQYGKTVGSDGIPRAELEKLSDATNVSIEELGRMIEDSSGIPSSQQAIENIQSTPGNLTIVPQPDETVQGLASLPGNLTAVPQPDDDSTGVQSLFDVEPEFTSVRTDTGADTEATATPEFTSVRGTGANVDTDTDTDTDVDTDTEVDTTTLITTDQPPEEEEVEVEVEDEVVDTDTGVEVDVDDPMIVPPETKTNDEGEEIVECPEGYTMVQTADGPICQKNVTSVRQRAGAGTRAYTSLATRGQRGPGQRRITVTDTERVDPITRSA